MPIVKNARQTISVFGTLFSGFITIVTNPFFWISMVLLFLPLIIINHIILFVGNFIILIANIIIFLLWLIFFGIVFVVVSIINALIVFLQGIDFDVLGVTIAPFAGLPVIPTPAFPTFGIIPYLSISQTSLLPNKVLFLWILELIGISLPL